MHINMVDCVSVLEASLPMSISNAIVDCIKIGSKLKPSIKAPYTLDLKPLPSHLHYAFLGVIEKFSLIILSNLSQEQEAKLLGILK